MRPYDTDREVVAVSNYKRSRADRLDLKYKGQMLCEWCNKYSQLDPQYFLGSDQKLKDKYNWSEYDLKTWRYYKDKIEVFYCDRDSCKKNREELVHVTYRITLAKRSRQQTIEI